MAVKEETKIYLSDEEQREVSRIIESTIENNNMSLDEEINYVYEVRPVTEDYARLRAYCRGFEEGYDNVLRAFEEKNAHIIKNRLWNIPYDKIRKTLQSY